MPVERWTATQVLALAPDAGAGRAARGLSGGPAWEAAGARDELLWGLCRGSGKRPYQVSVDLSGPAYRCSCPSRKFPCKHALGLLLRWSAAEVDGAEPPPWAQEWRQARTARAERAPAREPSDGPADEAAARRRAAQRAERVAGGVAELDRWLLDQVTHGLAGAEQAGEGPYAAMAARLVDAQAPGLAEAVRRAGRTVGVGPHWAERLLGRLAALRLLVSAHGRLDELPADLAATVRSRIGFPVSTEQVLAGAPVRDRWQVVGRSFSADDRLLTRRTWLLGATTRRPALLLAFAPLGRSLPAEAPPGTAFDADLCFYPGAAPLRAVVATRHGEPVPVGAPEGAGSVRAVLAGVAALRAADPWLGGVPVLLDAVRPAGPDRLVDADGDALDLHRGAEPPWWLLAVSGGHPVTVAGELGAGGLRPLAAWPADPAGRFAAAPADGDGAGPDPDDRARPLLPPDLVSAALVGTARRPWPGRADGAVEVGGRRLAAAGSAPGPAALLDAAAVAAAYRAAGPVPVAGAAADAPAGPEDRPVVPPAAADRLDRLLAGAGVPGGPEIAAGVLEDWLGTAAERGFRAPADALPALLDLGRRRTALRPAVALLAGRRGAWLAERRPDWSYLRTEQVDDATDADWETGTPGQRVAHLVALRRRDPAAGRELLAAGLDAETPDDRARFLRALAEGLGPDDEPLLERALQDRRAEVRAVAADLLGALPGSALTARMADRATAAVRFERRALGRGRWVVDPPAEVDPGMRRDGIAVAKGPGTRAMLLTEVVARAPLATWTAAAGRGPAQLLALPVTEGWAEPFRRGLVRAAVAARDTGWAAALADTAAAPGPGQGQEEELFVLARHRLLTPEQLSRHLGSALARDPAGARRVLAEVPGPWPDPLARAACAAIEALAGGSTFSWQLRELCGLAATGLPVQWAPWLARLAERLRARNPDGRAGALVTTLAAALTFRHDMTEELR